MNIEAHKNQLIKKLIDVQDEKLLDRIDAILNSDLIFAKTVDGESLTKSEYIPHIESISQSVADGAETYTSEEVRASIVSKKKSPFVCHFDKKAAIFTTKTIENENYLNGNNEKDFLVHFKQQ